MVNNSRDTCFRNFPLAPSLLNLVVDVFVVVQFSLYIHTEQAIAVITREFSIGIGVYYVCVVTVCYAQGVKDGNEVTDVVASFIKLQHVIQSSELGWGLQLIVEVYERL